MTDTSMAVEAFLADSVVAAEGKLYVQGGGWNAVMTPGFPIRQPRIGVGILISVPYGATNQTHRLNITLVDGDERPLPLGDAPPGTPPETLSEDGKILAIVGDFNLGRPPLLVPGDEQIVPIAVNLDGIIFDHPDRYNLVIRVDGTEVKRLHMRIQQFTPALQQR